MNWYDLPMLIFYGSLATVCPVVILVLILREMYLGRRALEWIAYDSGEYEGEVSNQEYNEEGLPICPHGFVDQSICAKCLEDADDNDA